jgi:hypothetical protein
VPPTTHQQWVSSRSTRRKHLRVSDVHRCLMACAAASSSRLLQSLVHPWQVAQNVCTTCSTLSAAVQLCSMLRPCSDM